MAWKIAFPFGLDMPDIHSASTAALVVYAVLLGGIALYFLNFLRSLFVVLHQAEAIIILPRALRGGSDMSMDSRKGASVHTEPGLYLVKWPFQSCIVISTALRHMRSDYIMVQSTDGKEVGVQVMVEWKVGSKSTDILDAVAAERDNEFGLGEVLRTSAVDAVTKHASKMSFAEIARCSLLNQALLKEMGDLVTAKKSGIVVVQCKLLDLKNFTTAEPGSSDMTG